MAKMQIVGLDAFKADLEAAKNLTRDEQKKILHAGAEVALNTMRQELMMEGHIRSKGLLNSLKIRMRSKGGKAYAQISPEGKHHVAHARGPKGERGKGAAYDVDAAEVGFVLEYGASSRGIDATHWLENSIALSEKYGGISDAMQQAFNEVLDAKTGGGGQ